MIPKLRRYQLPLLILIAVSSPWICLAEEVETRTATDSIVRWEDMNIDARKCLENYQWKPATFTVTVRPLKKVATFDRVVSFSSPRPSGNATNDQVSMEWFYARKDGKHLARAPGIVVVHESGKGMTVGRLLAQLLCQKGFHTFLVYLPTYGSRRPAVEESLKHNFLKLVAQGVTDVRRAKDAVAVLPEVEADTIAVLGVSLGGFVATNAAALDASFSHTFILLAGADIEGVIMRGAKDAAKVRERLNRDGVSDEQIKLLANEIEPIRIAHRLDGKRTWLFSAIHDQVVPLEHGVKLAQAIPLTKEHHVRMPANHYSGIVLLPLIIERIAVEMR
jgi:pimeloyl-ACP methyl ester carboxylesterase